MEYRMGIRFENFKQLESEEKNLAAELLEQIGEGEWQKEELYFYKNVETFAEYQLTEGWYADMEIQRDWNGAPNPIYFIDMNLFGKALTDSWDQSCNFKSKNGQILTSSHGW